MAQPLAPAPVFPSILCGTDNSAGGIAARRQAAWLANDPARLEIVPARELTALEPALLMGRSAPHDLLVLPSDPESHALATRAGVPVLLASWCREGRDLTDDILVVVGDQQGAMRAADLAAQLAVRHRGAVSIVAAPPRPREVDRAIAASSRIVLSTTGSAPRLLRGDDPPQRAVARAIAAVGATLTVLGVGDSWSPVPVTDLTRFVGCSVLMVPASNAAPGRVFASHQDGIRTWAREDHSVDRVPAY